MDLTAPLKLPDGRVCHHREPDRHEDRDVEVSPYGDTERQPVLVEGRWTTEDLDHGRFRCTQCGHVMYYTGSWRDFWVKGIPCSGSEGLLRAAPPPGGARRFPFTVPDGRGPLVYVASRASVPERPQMWRDLRELGWRISSSWIDEAGEGETGDFSELWERIEREIEASDGLILYALREDFPLRGALVEVGMAIGMGKPVAVVLGGTPFLQGRTLRPLGSWLMHPRCQMFADVEAARQWIGDCRG